MKNINTFGLTELSQNECKSLDGGGVITGILLIAGFFLTGVGIGYGTVAAIDALEGDDSKNSSCDCCCCKS